MPLHYIKSPERAKMYFPEQITGEVGELCEAVKTANKTTLLDLYSFSRNDHERITAAIKEDSDIENVTFFVVPSAFFGVDIADVDRYISDRLEKRPEIGRTVPVSKKPSLIERIRIRREERKLKDQYDEDDFDSYWDELEDGEEESAAPVVISSEADARHTEELTGEYIRHLDTESDELEQLLRSLDAPFVTTLLHLIDLSGMSDVDCYKRANVSRQTWHKIISDKNYRPSRITVISFAIALGLTVNDTRRLLATVGYTLSRSSKFDVIIEYFLKNEIYDIYVINETLFKYDQPCLGVVE